MGGGTHSGRGTRPYLVTSPLTIAWGKRGPVLDEVRDYRLSGDLVGPGLWVGCRAAGGGGGRVPLAQGCGPARGRLRDPAGRVQLRRLPADRRHRPVLS